MNFVFTLCTIHNKYSANLFPLLYMLLLLQIAQVTTVSTALSRACSWQTWIGLWIVELSYIRR